MELGAIKQSDFSKNCAGSFVSTIGGEIAFVPDNLPPNLDIASFALKMAEAMKAIGELNGACRRLQNPYILVRPLQRNEALTSSAMEGTFTSEDSLLFLEAGVEKQGDESTREVANYLAALSGALISLEQLPISHRVLKVAHGTLLSGLSVNRGARKRPGEYKREQNWIGGRVIENARFVPPPPNEALVCMDFLEKYINREQAEYPSAIMDIALVHYQIETIHPFADGNGRVGRMLISLMSVNSGLLEMPVLYLSPVLERHKDEYIDLMFGVSSKGDWSAWLNFFFDRVIESCNETTATIDRLLALQEDFRQIATEVSKSSNILLLVDALFETPVITVTEAAQRMNITYSAARSALDKLLETKIILPIDGFYPKAYYSPAIIKASRPYPTKPDKGQGDLFKS